MLKNRGMKAGRKFAALAEFIVLLVGINAWLGTFETETSKRIIGGGASFADAKRFGSYVAAFQSFKEAPVFGVGIEQNIYYMAVHNIFLQVLAFSGLAGLIFYLLFFIALFRGILLLPVQHSSYRAGLILWLFTYLLYDMSHTSGFWVSGLQEWTFVGILISLVSSRDFCRDGLKGPGAG
jgi:O-antigen ligase